MLAPENDQGNEQAMYYAKMLNDAKRRNIGIENYARHYILHVLNYDIICC